MRASRASVSAVMKFCATQPAWFDSMLMRFRLVSTVPRNASASLVLGAEDVDVVVPQAAAPREIARMARRTGRRFMVSSAMSDRRLAAGASNSHKDTARRSPLSLKLLTGLLLLTRVSGPSTSLLNARSQP
jgi:hypothetical protein